MPRTSSTSSSRGAAERLVRVPLRLLHRHPKNANMLSGEKRRKLRRNIERHGRYPPLIVRPHPDVSGAYQLLDGHQRFDLLLEMGRTDALCLVWPCDDETALLLLATLNRLHGEDLPVRRAELLTELNALLPVEALEALLPEDASAITQTLSLLELDSGKLLADLTAAAAQAASTAPRLVSFAVSPHDEPVIVEAIARAAAGLGGLNRRGRALAIVCRMFLQESGDE